MRYCSIDPGFKNLCVTLIEINGTFEEYTTELLDSHLYDISRSQTTVNDQLFVSAVQNIARFISGVDVVLVENQRFSKQKWLSYVEGGLVIGLGAMGYNVETIQPSVFKGYHRVSTGSYYKNKKLAKETASLYCENICTDHIADCVLMATYHWCVRSMTNSTDQPLRKPHLASPGPSLRDDPTTF